MSFIIYDITLLILFAIGVSIFLFTRKKNLKKEGLLFLYRTSWGIKLINYVGKKYKRTLKILSYFSIGVGYILMTLMLYLFGKILWIYLFQQEFVRMIKIPPVMPLIPYLPQIFSLDFLPPFYFTYWILILAVIAITHEFAHGILAAYNKVKIKTTGFGFFPFFLPVFLAAFVELDEKVMEKKDKFSQMAILSAGTFANIITTILFFVMLWVFFSFAFSPTGVIFDTYTTTSIEMASIASIGGFSLADNSYEEAINKVNETKLIEIQTDEGSFIATKELLEDQKENEEDIFVYHNAPAINSKLEGVIIEIEGVKITNKDKLIEELLTHSPGDEIIVKTKTEEEIKEHQIVLASHPKEENLPFLGIGFIDRTPQGFLGKVYSVLASFKKSEIYYEPKLGDFGVFVYNLLWWVILISISVALVNMLPVGIFDGGRFFYLTVLGITKSEKIAKRSFTLITYLFLLLLFLIMLFWGISFFG